jgi:predicted dehydrogenase
MSDPKADPITPESPSRRQILFQAAAAAAGAAALEACATGARGGPIPRAQGRAPLDGEEPIRMGVLGTGGMGTEHCRRILELVKEGRERVQIVALSDVCKSRLEAAKKICEERQGIAVETYGDYRDLLARSDLHAVLVASPEHWHARMAEDAILSGKDVYLEKPMTLRLPEALRLREVVRSTPGAILQVGTQQIMLPKFREARRLVAEGAIGKPVWSQTSYCRNSKDGEWLYYEIDPKWEPGVNLDWERWCGHLGRRPWDPEVYARWRRYRDFSTGIVGDLLVHVMTPLVYATDMGWPTRVVASGGHYVDKEMENHDQVNLSVEFEGEHTMVVAGSTANEAGLEPMIRGHRGNLYLGGNNCVLRPERIFAEEIEGRTIECPDIGNDQDALRLDWFRAIRTREAPASHVELGAKVMVVVDLATRSMWEGRAFEFDPSRMRARPA